MCEKPELYQRRWKEGLVISTANFLSSPVILVVFQKFMKGMCYEKQCISFHFFFFTKINVCLNSIFHELFEALLCISCFSSNGAWFYSKIWNWNTLVWSKIANSLSVPFQYRNLFMSFPEPEIMNARFPDALIAFWLSPFHGGDINYQFHFCVQSIWTNASK